MINILAGLILLFLGVLAAYAIFIIVAMACVRVLMAVGAVGAGLAELWRSLRGQLHGERLR